MTPNEVKQGDRRIFRLGEKEKRRPNFPGKKGAKREF